MVVIMEWVITALAKEERIMRRQLIAVGHVFRRVHFANTALLSLQNLSIRRDWVCIAIVTVPFRRNVARRKYAHVLAVALVRIQIMRA